jgi:hypothetical protein
VVFPLAVSVVNVPAAGVTLPIIPCTDVAVATPKTGVTNVGLVANTKAPVPVSSVTAVLRFAEEGVAKNVATPVPSPLTPVEIGNPVALVSVAADGVPRFGVVSAGLLANTNAPVPVSSVTALAKLADEGVARNVATLEPKPLTPVETGKPVQFVNVPEVGVPKIGVVKLGEVADKATPLIVPPVIAPLVMVLLDNVVPLIEPPVIAPLVIVLLDKVVPVIVPLVKVVPVIEPPEITGFVNVFPDRATPLIEPPVITGVVMVYVPPRIPSPTSRICAIMSRMVSFTAEGSIPSGAPSGGAALLFAGVREYFVYAIIFLTVVLQIADLQEMLISLVNL